MLDIAMLIIAISILLRVIAEIVGTLIQLYKDKRKTYKITLSHIKLNNEYSFVTYVYATSIVRAAHEIQDKAYVIRSIEEVKDV